MKKVIRASKKYVDTPMDRLYSALGISRWDSKIKLAEISEGKYNFKIYSYYYSLSSEDIAKYKERIKKIGGKYIDVKRGDIYFYFDLNKFKEAYDKESQEAEDAYSNELNAMDIDAYKPSKAILDKLANYRNKGSKVNVKAIKDRNKLLTYYYGAVILDWENLAGACRDALPWEDRDLLEAISRRVANDESYADSRTDMEKKLDLPDSKGLFTFESDSCWVPKKILQFFIDNDIKVDFGKRTSGAHYDHNGRQWSEIEHMKIHKDDDHIINYDLVVHTDEGGGPNTYTGNRTAERTSIKNVLDDIKDYLS